MFTSLVQDRRHFAWSPWLPEAAQSSMMTVILRGTPPTQRSLTPYKYDVTETSVRFKGQILTEASELLPYAYILTSFYLFCTFELLTNCMARPNVLLLRILVVPGSNLSPYTGYPEDFSSVPPDKCRNNTLNCA
jgi:hypothetical protein